MKKTNLIMGMMCLLSLPAFGQNKDTDSSEIESMDEVLISSQRLGETRLNSTRQIEVITTKQIEIAQQGTMAEVLSQSGQVMMQKSQMGGGSPVIRGFEASRVLTVVDGVRMNNATYRAGHLQDIITLDQFMLERVEIFFGSGSTLYGSDALGGVLYMKSRDPKFRNRKFGFASANANLRNMGASQSKIANLNFELSGSKVAFLFNATRSDFGDLRMGAQRNFSDIDTFGYRRYYADRINGRDTQLLNADPFVQKGSGYSQNDFFTKLMVKTGAYTHSLNVQLSLCEVIPRYDRMTETGSNGLSYSTWEYAPQNRTFVSYTLLFPNLGKWKHRIILSNQGTQVGRVTRNFKSANERTQEDKVNMSAINYDVSYSVNNKFKVGGGAEIVSNTVSSKATNLNVNTNTITDIKNTRYADGGANTLSAGVFANGIYTVRPNDLIVEGGFRVAYYSLEANYTEQNFLKLPYSKAEVSNIAPVFNLGLTKNMGLKGLFFKASVATGFRNPNVDDMTKLFESVSGTKLVIPNKDLKPERTSTLDLAISYTGESSRFEAGTYYTKIDQLLIDQRAVYNGSDSFLFDGRMTPVFQMVNTAGGYVTGAWFAAKFRLVSHLFADFNYTTTYGRYRATEKSMWAPLDHVAPDHGRAGLRWASSEWQMEAFMLFNGWKRAKDYSPSGEDNAQYSAGGKTPSWETYNVRALWTVNKYLSLGFGVENILDLRYRVFASGISSPGRNIVFSLKASI
jgi:hemoglobin/transferrin/lactoferrin receptor protein